MLMCFIFLSECYITFKNYIFWGKKGIWLHYNKLIIIKGLPFSVESNKSTWCTDSTLETAESTSKAGSNGR